LKKVLIIEDDKDTLDIIHFLVDDLNIDVVASSQILLITDIESMAPDLILMDHWVGSGLGGDFCLQIKSNPATKHIPVIILSAHSNIVQIAQKSCADGYLPKPFDLDEITNVIKQFIEKDN